MTYAHKKTCIGKHTVTIYNSQNWEVPKDSLTVHKQTCSIFTHWNVAHQGV